MPAFEQENGRRAHVIVGPDWTQGRSEPRVEILARSAGHATAYDDISDALGTDGLVYTPGEPPGEPSSTSKRTPTPAKDPNRRMSDDAWLISTAAGHPIDPEEDLFAQLNGDLLEDIDSSRVASEEAQGLCL